MTKNQQTYKILRISLFLFLSCLLFVYFVSINFSKKNKTQYFTVQELREKHKNYLNNSPFKKTLQLTKEERKAIGLPPNKYYERMWELTLNPATGKPEPFKVFDVQNKLIKNKKSVSAKAPGETVANSWTDRGPNNIGGRTRAVLFDPNDGTNKRVYAAGVSGGLWKTEDITDANASWTLVAGVPGNMNVSSITVDPRNSNIWYLATGEQSTFGAAVGNGVYKTTDGGTNWTQLNVQLAGGSDFVYNSSNTFLAGIYYINDIIAWDNGTSTELFIGVGGHAYGDASNPSNWLGLQSAGLYRSTDDGANWSRIESVTMDFEFGGKTYFYIPNDFEISANNTLWMGTVTTPGIGGGGGGRIFSSTDGATWTEAADSPLADSNRTEIAVSATNANKLYALTEGASTNGPHIFATENAFGNSTGNTTIELAKPSDADNGIPANDFTRGQDFYDLVIEVDPNNHDIIYVGGIDLFRSTQGRNTDLVSEWAQISKWSENPNLNTLNCSYVHADQHAFVFRPGNSNQAAIGTDGGMFFATSLTTAAGNDVIIERNKDYSVTQFYYGGYGQDLVTEFIVAGAQDNGTQFIDGAAPGSNASIWVNGGDGAYSTIDKDLNYMIVSYVYSNHTYLNLPYNGTGYTIDNNNSEGDFINAAGLDHNLNIMYSNGSSSSTNRINRYALGSSSASKTQLTNALLTGEPTAFKASPHTTTSTLLLVGTDDGKLIRLKNANGATNSIVWEDLTGPSFVGSISDIEFGATENDIVVTFHNYGVTSIWVTTNGGASWKSKEGDFPDIPVKSFLQNPLAANEVILGTELGVWTSNNFNEDSPNWISAYNGMQDVKVVDLDLRTADNSVLATTHGRGTFTGTFTSDTSPTFTISSQNSVVEVCSPSNAVFNFDFTAIAGYNTSTSFSVSNVPTGASTSFDTNALSTTGTFQLTVSDITNVTTGEYVLTVTGTGAKTISTDIMLRVLSDSPVINLSPVTGTTNINTVNSVLSWDVSAGATSYDIDIATDAGFNTIIETASPVSNSYQISTTLTNSTVYYWRVRANNSCAVGQYSATQSFQTAPTDTCNSSTNNTSVPIPDGAGSNQAGTPATSVINIASTATVSDVNITINISHTYIQDLVITLISPTGTEIVLFNRECSNEDGIQVTYDDEASAIISCANPVTGTAIPTNLLSGFDGENPAGNWTLKVVDYYTGDTGTINSWSLELCEAQSVTNSTFTNNPITVGTNSTYIVKQTDIEASSTGSTAAEQVYMLTTLPSVGQLRLNNITLGIGDTFSQNDVNTGLVTYVNTSGVTTTDLFKADITNATGGFLADQQIDITIDATLSVDEAFFETSGLTVFPTVSDGRFAITSKTNIGTLTVELFKLTGQTVYKGSLNLFKGDVGYIEANYLPSGIYVLKISSENKQGSKKLVIN